MKLTEMTVEVRQGLFDALYEEANEDGKDLIDYIRSLEEWMLVGEGLPEAVDDLGWSDECNVLATSEWHYVAQYSHRLKSWKSTETGAVLEDITHWKLVPLLPDPKRKTPEESSSGAVD